MRSDDPEVRPTHGDVPHAVGHDVPHAHLASLYRTAVSYTGSVHAEELVRDTLATALDTAFEADDDAFVRLHAVLWAAYVERRSGPGDGLGADANGHFMRRGIGGRRPRMNGWRLISRRRSQPGPLDDRDAVGNALAELPPRTRAAVYLVDAEGCTYAQLADVLGVSVDQATDLLHRGRRQIARRALRRSRGRSVA